MKFEIEQAVDELMFEPQSDLAHASRVEILTKFGAPGDWQKIADELYGQPHCDLSHARDDEVKMAVQALVKKGVFEW